MFALSFSLVHCLSDVFFVSLPLPDILLGVDLNIYLPGYSISRDVFSSSQLTIGDSLLSPNQSISTAKTFKLWDWLFQNTFLGRLALGEVFIYTNGYCNDHYLSLQPQDSILAKYTIFGIFADRDFYNMAKFNKLRLQ